MKRFSEIEYFDDNDLLIDESLDENIYLYEIDEGVDFLNLAKVLGDKLQSARSAMNDIKKFSKNVKLSFKGFNANLTNKNDKLDIDTRTKIYNEINDTHDLNDKVNKIIDIWNNGINNNETKQQFLNSGFATYMLLYGKQLASDDKYKSNEKNNQIKTLDNALSSIPSGIKKLAKNVWDKAKSFVNKNKENNEEPSNNVEKPNNGETPTPKDDEVKTEVEKVASEDPIKTLSNQANIDNKKLEGAVYQMMLNKDGEIKWNLDNTNNIMIGISAIICGCVLIDNEEVKKNILTACGIQSGEEFINKISNTVEKVAN